MQNIFDNCSEKSPQKFISSIAAMNRDLVEIYNKITDLKSKLPNVDVNLDFPEIVVVGAQVANIQF